MFTSPRHSLLVLRLGLAAVFLWWGIDQFRHAALWLATWLPASWTAIAARWGWLETRLLLVLAVFFTLAGLSLLLGVFQKLFAFLAILLLTGWLLTSGLTIGSVPYCGLIGALLAVLFWPADRARF